MRYARVEGGIVQNVEEWVEGTAEPGLIASETANVGDDYVDGVFIPPPPAEE